MGKRRRSKVTVEHEGDEPAAPPPQKQQQKQQQKQKQQKAKKAKKPLQFGSTRPSLSASPRHVLGCAQTGRWSRWTSWWWTQTTIVPYR